MRPLGGLRRFYYCADNEKIANRQRLILCGYARLWRTLCVVAFAAGVVARPFVGGRAATVRSDKFPALGTTLLR